VGIVCATVSVVNPKVPVVTRVISSPAVTRDKRAVLTVAAPTMGSVVTHFVVGPPPQIQAVVVRFVVGQIQSAVGEHVILQTRQKCTLLKWGAAVWIPVASPKERTKCK
jgi:hypothetical protein